MSRTDLQIHITHTGYHNLIDLDCDINITEPKARYNSDWETNKYGNLLTNLCKNMDFAIMNGRTDGDIHGRYTYHNPKKGASVVDYGVASASLMSTIKYFHVQTPCVLSDHSLIDAGIDIPCHALLVSNTPELKPLNESYNWSTSSAENYIQVLTSDLLSQNINHVLQNKYEQNEHGTDALSNLQNSSRF